MTFASLGAGEWTAIITAIAGGFGVLITGIGTVWQKIRAMNNDTLLKIKKIDAATAKLEAHNKSKNLEIANKELIAELKTSRQEIHDIRDLANKYVTENAVLKARFEDYERRHKEYENRIEECEKDRFRLWEVLRQNGINEPPT